MTKHTPGPWEIYDSSDENHIAIKGFFPRTGGAHVADVLGSANARLIAAAPDLLATLKAIAVAADGVELIVRHQYPAMADSLRIRVSDAKAAIAKAEP